jgi:hypothetical protein
MIKKTLISALAILMIITGFTYPHGEMKQLKGRREIKKLQYLDKKKRIKIKDSINGEKESRTEIVQKHLKKHNGWLIAGGVVGGLAVVAGLIFGGIYWGLAAVLPRS